MCRKETGNGTGNYHDKRGPQAGGDIYGRVCTNDDPEKMKDSIERLTNPFDNSICEKCAAIKKAFTLKINEQVAQNYFVHGEQGEKKGISLDRNLVEWECEL